MADDGALKEQLARWYQSGDELAYRRVYEELRRRLSSPREVVEVLGNGAVDEVRQSLLARLLSRNDERLRDAASPMGFVLKAWKNELCTQLRKWGPRATPSAEVVEYFREATEKPGIEVAEARIDAERALAIASKLEGKGRLAVLLTTRPTRIADSDWDELVASHPPPPPSRPTTPMDRDEASCLLYPPRGPETDKARYQRLNSFDKTYKRAIALIRRELGEDK